VPQRRSSRFVLALFLTAAASVGFVLTASAVSSASKPRSEAVVTITVSGTQVSGHGASFTYTDNAPSGVTVSGTLSCFSVELYGLIDATFDNGSYTIDGSSCSGLVLSDPAHYAISFVGATNGFVVTAFPGYDLVGTDGGVFVFPQGQGSGFYGTLSGRFINVNNIVGIVTVNDDEGYDVVGNDGGVFVLNRGLPGFYGSLPALGVNVHNIVGIVPTVDGLGYFLVGSDGGVFSFGDAPFEDSLPGLDISVDNIVGMVPTSDDKGYWLVSDDGNVYALGEAKSYGSLGGNSSVPIVGMAVTSDSKGYWLAGDDGSVYAYGDAKTYGSLPALGVSVSNIVSIVPTTTGQGYWLVGSDGGIFSFGDAKFYGSLPALGVSVNTIVGAVPTG
jgi:hypothetical protein